MIWFLSKNTGNAVGNVELSFSLLEKSMQEYQFIYKENKRTSYAFSYQPNLTTISEMSEFLQTASEDGISAWKASRFANTLYINQTPVVYTVGL